MKQLRMLPLIAIFSIACTGQNNALLIANNATEPDVKPFKVQRKGASSDSVYTGVPQSSNSKLQNKEAPSDSVYVGAQADSVYGGAQQTGTFNLQSKSVPWPDYFTLPKYTNRNNNIKYDPSTDIIGAGFTDTKGNTWFATSNRGVYRFDGKSFTFFTTLDGLCNNDVATIYEDHRGFIWFGTQDGVSRYDGTNFTNFAVPAYEPSARNFDAIAFLSSLTIFFQQPAQVAIKNPKTVVEIVQDKTGGIWFATLGNGAYCCHQTCSAITNKTTNGPDMRSIITMTADKDGNIWFAGRGGNLWRYDGTTFVDFSRMVAKEGC